MVIGGCFQSEGVEQRGNMSMASLALHSQHYTWLIHMPRKENPSFDLIGAEKWYFCFFQNHEMFCSPIKVLVFFSFFEVCFHAHK